MSFILELRSFVSFQLWRKELFRGDLESAVNRAHGIVELLKESKYELSEAGFILVCGCYFFMGHFLPARQAALRAEKVAGHDSVRRSRHFRGDVNDPLAATLCYKSLCEFHAGETEASSSTMLRAVNEALSVQRPHALVVTLFFRAILSFFQKDREQVGKTAEEMIAIGSRNSYAVWMIAGSILQGWALGGERGKKQIQQGILEWTNRGAKLCLTFWYELDAEVSMGLADWSSATASLTLGHQRGAETEERWREVPIRAKKAFCLLKLGGARSDAQGEFDELIQLCNEQGSPALREEVASWMSA